jgi:hypothetical protein
MEMEMRKKPETRKERVEGAVIKSTKPAAGTPATGLWHKTAKIDQVEGRPRSAWELLGKIHLKI